MLGQNISTGTNIWLPIGLTWLNLAKISPNLAPWWSYINRGLYINFGGVYGVFHVGNVWIQPWANFAHYMDPTFTLEYVNLPTDVISNWYVPLLRWITDITSMDNGYYLSWDVHRHSANATDQFSYQKLKMTQEELILPTAVISNPKLAGFLNPKAIKVTV